MLAQIPDILPNAGRSAEMTYYETPAGAKVFAAGALNFAASVDQPVVSQMLENLLGTPEPAVSGLLDVGYGNEVYWESHGEGAPALVVHGGPGSGCGLLPRVLRHIAVPRRARRPAQLREEPASCK